MQPKLDQATKDLLIANGKVGKTKRHCMEWVLAAVQKIPAMTSADLNNFSFELFSFCWQVKQNPPIPASLGFASEEVPQISPKEAKKILKVFETAIESALSKKNIDLGTSKKRIKIIWADHQKSYWADSGVYDSPRNAACDALSDLIVEFGHLIKKCGAPRPWGGGDRCEKIFLPRRPNQAYCSSGCQNRETTRATRERQKARPKRKPSRKKK